MGSGVMNLGGGLKTSTTATQEQQTANAAPSCNSATGIGTEHLERISTPDIYQFDHNRRHKKHNSIDTAGFESVLVQ